MPTTYYPYDNGTVGPSGPAGPQGPAGAAGTPGVVQSVNGKSSTAVVLAATDVNALPSNANATLEATYLDINRAAGNYRAFRWKTAGVSRWEAQADDVAETGSAAGSDFRLSARNDDGSFGRTVIHAKRSDGTISLGTTTHHGSAQVTSSGSVGLRDVGADPATTTGGVFLYAKGGVPFFKNADGTSFQVAPVSYPVSSVNGRTGAVTLGASDVGALPSNANATLGAARLSLNTAAGTFRLFSIQSSGVDRWTIGTNSAAETGSDVGSDLRITARKDDGSFASTPLHVTRSTGQVSFGAETKHGSAVTTSHGAIGVMDIASDPTAATGGVQLYSKAGLPYIMKGDGTVFQVGSGGSGGGAVDSVNGQTGTVTLDADDVGALPAAGGTLAGKLTQVGDGVNNLVEWKSPGGTLATRIGPNGNFVAEGTFYSKAGMQLGSTNFDLGGGYGGIIGMDNAATVPTTNPTGGIIVYAENGVLKVRQADGTIVTASNRLVDSVNGQTGAVNLTIADLNGVAWTDRGAVNGVASLDSTTKVPIAQLPDPSVPSGFTPESIGLKAWVADPATTMSGFDYPGVAKGRMAAVYINRSMSVSKIAWHIFGYAGGLLSGSWAGIYNTSGTLMRATGDMSTASYEPAEQHGVGGAVSTSNLTSAVTLSPGVYYVIWRMNYTASPVDGPALMRFDSSSTCAAVYGVSSVRRFGAFTVSNTTAPSTITPSWETDPLRFWVGLA
ncbi:minor tail protein [Streptomyces phage Andris]|nr:minor tail protein [Streptomyces phage Andris]